MEENNKIDQLEEEFEEEKSKLRLKYTIIIFIVAIVVAILSSEVTMRISKRRIAGNDRAQSFCPQTNITDALRPLRHAPRSFTGGRRKRLTRIAPFFKEAAA